MTDLNLLTRANAARWAHAGLTRAPELSGIAARLVSGKSRFQLMAARTRVPWFIIAVIKERESGADPAWLCNIANGQSIHIKTTIEPKGRGPFPTWEDAAYDALVNCAPYASRWKDWSAGGALTLLEQYNGLGYAMKGVPSPYVWSGTDQYIAGKYVADHVYSATTVDKQLGCAGIIMAMQAIDPSIQFGGNANVGVLASGRPVVSPSPSTVPSITNPARGSIGAWFASFFKKAA